MALIMMINPTDSEHNKAYFAQLTTLTQTQGSKGGLVCQHDVESLYQCVCQIPTKHDTNNQTHKQIQTLECNLCLCNWNRMLKSQLWFCRNIHADCEPSPASIEHVSDNCNDHLRNRGAEISSAALINVSNPERMVPMQHKCNKKAQCYFCT